MDMTAGLQTVRAIGFGFSEGDLNKEVVYPALADIVSRPLASRLGDVNQSVIMTQNRFSTPPPRFIDDIWTH
jgi:hypothetical protein